MMLKKKSNNWARLKLLLLVPAGVFILQAFAHPELVAKPLETLNASALPASFSKSTTILQNDQKKKAEYYMVDNRRMTNEEYNDFVKNKVTRSSANMDELTNPAGKIIKVVSYQKTDKGNIPSSPIYLELKKGVKTEATNTVPPPPPPPPLGEVEVYYKDVAKPERIMINPGLAKSKHFMNNLNKVYTDKIVKVNVIAYSKDAKDKFKEDFEFADKMLKDKIKYQVEYSSEFKNE